jgi:hypothetical protein
VYCAGGVCGKGQICCFDPTSNNPPDMCGTHGQCGPGYVELSCSQPSDCPGQQCCATFTLIQTAQGMLRVYQSVACASQCDNPMSQLPICTNDPGVCPVGTMCVQSTLLGPPYQICNQ